jgi:hypothetical protein
MHAFGTSGSCSAMKTGSITRVLKQQQMISGSLQPGCKGCVNTSATSRAAVHACAAILLHISLLTGHAGPYCPLPAVLGCCCVLLPVPLAFMMQSGAFTQTGTAPLSMPFLDWLEQQAAYTASTAAADAAAADGPAAKRRRISEQASGTQGTPAGGQYACGMACMIETHLHLQRGVL